MRRRKEKEKEKEEEACVLPLPFIQSEREKRKQNREVERRKKNHIDYKICMDLFLLALSFYVWPFPAPSCWKKAPHIPPRGESPSKLRLCYTQRIAAGSPFPPCFSAAASTTQRVTCPTATRQRPKRLQYVITHTHRHRHQYTY
jgi:hypothetical protein